MPGWHDATIELQRSGELQMLGLIQEQHPDRSRLFQQWRQMPWPVMVDSLDLLEIAVVPLTLAIDEHGIVRHRGLRPADAARIGELFLDREYPAPAAVPSPSAPESHSPPESRDAATSHLRHPEEATSWRRRGDELARWGLATSPLALPTSVSSSPDRERVRDRVVARLDAAISAYGRAIEIDPEDGWSSFRRGVAYRFRYDSGAGRDGDFQAAVDDWQRALEIDPNNYIWRRRIQQYGPRLDKPYPFYDWIDRARREIAARGETPHPLRVEPRGSEIARPARELAEGESGDHSDESLHPPLDPRGRIHRDATRLIEIEATLVPKRLRPGDAARLHLVFRPDRGQLAHWNNEVDPLVVQLDSVPGVEIAERVLVGDHGRGAISDETRRLETEIRLLEAPGGPEGIPSLSGYALYYVCEDVDGVCLYRRQDLEVPLGKW